MAITMPNNKYRIALPLMEVKTPQGWILFFSEPKERPAEAPFWVIGKKEDRPRSCNEQQD